MNRRTVLATAGLTLAVPFVGCLTAGDTPGDDGNEGTTDPTTDIVIEVSNVTSAAETVHLLVTAEGESIFEASVPIEPDGRTFVDPDLDERGQYELAATVDDERDASVPFGLEEFDLRMGSNLIVIVREGTIEILIEE